MKKKYIYFMRIGILSILLILLFAYTMLLNLKIKFSWMVMYGCYWERVWELVEKNPQTTFESIVWII